MRIETYPKRRRGYVNDVHIASLSAPRDVAPLVRRVPAEPCYADFLVAANDTLQVSA
jgi:hypothetical protein